MENRPKMKLLHLGQEEVYLHFPNWLTRWVLVIQNALAAHPHVILNVLV